MKVEPEFERFAALYNSGKPQVVYTRLTGDLETPVSVFLKIGARQPSSFLFESVHGGEARGRYSVIGIEPDLVWRCRNGKAEINRNAVNEPDSFVADTGSPLDSLRNLVTEIRLALPPDLPAMATGLFGYLGYDMVRLIERLGDPPPDSLNLPDAILVRPTVVVIFDNVRDEITIVTPVWPAIGDAATAYSDTRRRLENVITRIERQQARLAHDEEAKASSPGVQSNTTHAEYLAIVERAKEFIRAGDVFQVVPSQRFS